MRILSFTLIIFLLFNSSANSIAQTVSCPSNLDFELGNFTNWRLYTGSCCPINTPTLSGAVANRHVITSGTGTDPFGGFPIVAPGGGSYSLKLGNSNVGAQAERARYYLHVPSGVNNYSVIFRYAVVFEDPSHIAADQPRFEIKAFDSITNAIINCSQFTYIATSNLPGFTLSPLSATYASTIYYKSWTTASINLSGYAGRTVVLDFASGDCDQGGHFGYGYVDMNCGLFQVAYNACDTASTVTLSAPPGFQSYTWRDSSSSWAYVDTGQTITIARPTTTKTYAVILTPYTGFGCPDTLYTRVTINNLVVNPTNDTVVCGGNVQLSAGASASAAPLTYNWSPSTNLSCTTCANPLASPTVSRTYYVTVTDGNGCSKTDSVKLTVSNPLVSHNSQNVSCYNASNGSATAIVSGGRSPYSYSWNTTPVNTNATITGLNPGTYIVTVTDSIGCIKRDTVTITQPAILNASISARSNVSCHNGNNGTATVSVTGGTPNYSYSWNTTPAQTSATATGLTAGNYIVTVTDSKGCIDTATVTTTQPTSVNATISASTNVNCSNSNIGSATVSVNGGTPGYLYSWNTTPAQTAITATGLYAGNYIVTVTDTNGCTDTAMVTITQTGGLIASISTSTDVSCYNGNNGTATVAVTGGAPTYTYSWNTTPVQTAATATGLTAGNHIVTVTDINGCSDTALVTITQPNVLNATISTSTNVSCNNGNNGTATVSVIGGTPTYSYSWNITPAQTTATATGLAAGNYIVTVTDNKGCSDTSLVTITQPTSLSASLSARTDVSCYNGNNGTATATATGGTPTYSYIWNTSPAQTTSVATGLSAGSYFVSVTDSKGCVDTAVVTIIQPSVLNASISATTTVSCNGGNNGTASVIATGGTPTYTYSWNTTPAQTGTTATGLTAGGYIVTVTDSKGCSDTAIANITQQSSLNATISSITNVNCHNGNNGTATVLATGGTPGYSYNWNTSPAQTTATATGLPAGSYTVTVTDNNGCYDTAIATISEPPVLNASISASTNVSCYSGNSGTATVTVTGGTPVYTYNWNTTPVQTTGIATGLTAGNYIVTVTDSKGCSDTALAIISQPTLINPTITASTNVTCNGGNNGTATVSATGGTPGYSYSWNTTPVQNTATATGLAAGNYIVTVTDSKGCYRTANVTITQPAVLNAVISANTSVSCNGGNNGTASVNVTGGTPGYLYSWNTIPVKTTAIATGLSAGNYIVTVTDSKGCIDTATTTITQPALLNPAISTSSNVTCHGGNNGTATVTVSGGSPAYVYTWNTTPVQSTATATGLSIGNYIVTVSDSKGCSDTAMVTITQPPLLNPVITASSNVTCYGGNNGTATVSVSGGAPAYSYSWNTTPVQTNATATGLVAGSYNVTVTDNNGCTQVATVIITEPNPFTVTADEMQKTCVGTANGIVAITSISGGVAPFSYVWNTTPKQSGDTAKGLFAGSYTITVTDSKGCTAKANASVNNYPDIILSVTPDQNICDGAQIQLSVSGALTYTWYNSKTLSCNTCDNPIAKPVEQTVYTVVGIDANYCIDTANVNIGIITRQVVAVGPSLDICEGEAAKLHAEGGTEYSWSPANWLDNAKSANPYSSATDSMVYTVVIKQNECFTDTMHQVVNVNPKPEVDLGPDLSGVAGKIFQLEAKSHDADKIEWTPTTGLSCTDCFNPTATVEKSIIYKAVVTTKMGCRDEDDITITVKCDGSIFAMPNTFTPNGDGLNDRFWPITSGTAIIDRMSVYNRWGEKLFEANGIKPNDPASGWDGTYKNQQLTPDVFVYIIESRCANGEKMFLKGDISLIR